MLLPRVTEGSAAAVARHDPRVDLDDGDLGRQVHRPLRVHLKMITKNKLKDGLEILHLVGRNCS